MIRVYTDGASSGTPGNAGCGFYIEKDGIELTRGGKHLGCKTNNYAELSGAILGLQKVYDIIPNFEKSEGITLITDSAYVCNCFKDKWYIKWRQNGWQTSKKTPVINVELWKQLIELVEKLGVKFEKVAGHSGNKQNDIVDFLAKSFKEDIADVCNKREI